MDSRRCGRCRPKPAGGCGHRNHGPASADSVWTRRDRCRSLQQTRPPAVRRPRVSNLHPATDQAARRGRVDTHPSPPLHIVPPAQGPHPPSRGRRHGLSAVCAAPQRGEVQRLRPAAISAGAAGRRSSALQHLLAPQSGDDVRHLRPQVPGPPIGAAGLSTLSDVSDRTVHPLSPGSAGEHQAGRRSTLPQMRPPSAPHLCAMSVPAGTCRPRSGLPCLRQP